MVEALLRRAILFPEKKYVPTFHKQDWEGYKVYLELNNWWRGRFKWFPLWEAMPKLSELIYYKHLDLKHVTVKTFRHKQKASLQLPTSLIANAGQVRYFILAGEAESLSSSALMQDLLVTDIKTSEAKAMRLFPRILYLVSILSGGFLGYGLTQLLS